MPNLTFPIRSDKLTMSVQVEEQIESRQTEFQRIDIYQTAAFGRVLMLDGHIQLSELDEHAYHEGLVQIPLLAIPSPESALVVGGGDGGVLRELCRHEGLRRIVMVEIDEGVIDSCRRHLPGLSEGAFEDPRVELIVGDAFDYVKNASETFDLIVMDSTDTYEDEEGALSEQLFTDPFYKDLSRLLSDQGVVVTQADNLLFCPYSLESIQSTFARVFPKTGSYLALVPSFGGFSGYCWASKGTEVGHSPDSLERSPIAYRYLNAATYALAFTPLGL